MSLESSSSEVSLKLLIDTKGKSVLFAEAGKEFVDFLIRILSLPLATVINLLKKQELVGSLTHLYESIESLSDSYLQPNQTKDTLLKPVSSGFVPLLALNEAPPTMAMNFYKCPNCHRYFTDDPRAVCSYCGAKMTSRMTYVPPPPGDEKLVSEGDGFVKGVVTYMVMDDLVVTPLSTISSITLLNKCNVTEVSALEEKVVSFGVDEALKLLNASLKSKKVLTDVFLEGI
ncbi:hypothetical protein CASFOL_035014 [Castilleja foliolosa]|uniref:DUF674 domain-containing protein n=1 Tax=Castilleja foliolosa TaxID=1961234 RepID=A0ABD3BTR3_9LAMI